MKMNKNEIVVFVKGFWNRLCNLFFPPRCPFCDSLLSADEKLWCQKCVPKIKLVSGDYCMKCGKKVDASQQYCEDCQKYGHFFLKGRSVLAYDDITKAAIYRFKYGGRKEYAKAFGYLMYNALRDELEQIKPDALIPVPLSRKRYRQRGYNQAYLLAKWLGRFSKIHVDDTVARRVKNTRPQKMLSRRERQNNLKKAFIIKENDVKLSTIVLIDDIYTTGSTVDALADAFMKKGVQNVYVISLACGVS